MNTTPEKDTAQDQARCQLESIVEMIAAMNTGPYGERETARETILEDALSVEVRTAWHSPTSERVAPSEYCILLSTGGPACRIVGDLTEHGDVDSARIEYQDWGTPWTQLFSLTDDEEEALLGYANQFCFA